MRICALASPVRTLSLLHLNTPSSLAAPKNWNQSFYMLDLKTLLCAGATALVTVAVTATLVIAESRKDEKLTKPSSIESVLHERPNLADGRGPRVDLELARRIYTRLKEDPDIPIEFAANIGLLLMGVRRVVQLDSGFYPEFGETGVLPTAPRDLSCMMPPRMNRSSSTMAWQQQRILLHAEGVLEVAHVSSGSDVVIVHRDDPLAATTDLAGVSKELLGSFLDPVYDVSEWIDGMLERSGLHQVYFQVIDPTGCKFGKYEIGPIIVMIIDSPSLQAGFSQIFARYSYFRDALRHLDPLLQMELSFYSKPENDKTWKQQPTLKSCVMQNISGIHRPQSVRQHISSSNRRPDALHNGSFFGQPAEELAHPTPTTPTVTSPTQLPVVEEAAPE